MICLLEKGCGGGGVDCLGRKMMVVVIEGICSKEVLVV